MAKRHYINGKDLLAALTAYRAAVATAKAAGLPKPTIPRYIAEAIMLISQRMSRMQKFSKYPFLEDMIGDAIELSCRYIHNFNPEKSANAFAYLSRICYNAFIARITTEKRQLYTKFSAIKRYEIHGETFHKQAMKDSYGDQAYSDIDQFMTDFEAFTAKVKAKAEVYKNKPANEKRPRGRPPKNAVAK